jgi:hypothetical protein
MKMIPALTFAAIAAASSLPAAAAVSPAFAFAVAKAPHPLALDPSLADPVWQAGKVPQNGAWQNVASKLAAPHATTVYMLYDDKNLYVAFEAEQKGTPIVATQTTNNVGYGTDDFVSVGIDTSASGSQNYLFETTPRGVRYQQASENVRYRPDWQSAATTGDGSWKAVMIIPLDIMRIRGGKSQTWRIDFYRNVAAAGDHLTWSYDGVMQDNGSGNWPDFNNVRFWASATNLALMTTTSIRPKPHAEIYGLATAGSDRDLFQQANGSFLAQNVREAGIDVTVPITPTINFVGTANPDFSNVETDQQTIAPQEFRRLLNEYRPFFAQGAGFMNPNPSGLSNFISPQNAVFYSPSIGPFDMGAKAEGTFGNESFGLMNFRGFDDVTGNTFNDDVFGYHHLLQDNTFQYWADGVLAHHSISGHDSTFEGGFKGRNLKNGFVYSFNTAVEQASNSWLPTGIAQSTNAFVDVHKPNYETLVQWVDTTPSYNPIDGFTSNSDIRGPMAVLNFNGSTKTLKNWALIFTGDRWLDRSGAVHEADTSAAFNATFKNKFSLNGVGPVVSSLRSYDVPAGPGCSGPIVGQDFFTGSPCYLNGQNVQFNLMSVPAGYGDGGPTPVDVSANWGRFGGNELHFYTSQTSRPIGSRMTLGLEYDGTYERPLLGGPLSSQFLRRVTLGINTGADSNLAFSLRSVNGLGGFITQPGVNLAAAFHMRMQSGDLYMDYGTPAANVTIHRFVVKYVIRAGGDAGT